ncbi:hypothetical protein LSH36_645g01085 [Paralvinella palmiformis]|uniref:Sulfotransferase domain-containing protein n=1 Tax=Paralvinella palmiformis TaxID=53620 RepID=A0AAD9J4K4_9ANNE|nr:hypothetical protein LSH36_645g01085 [Paralvinella palmiformis]
MYGLAMIKHRAILLALIAFLAFTHIPSVKEKLLKIESKADNAAPFNKIAFGQQNGKFSAGTYLNITTFTPVTMTQPPTLHPLEAWHMKRQNLLSKKAVKVFLFAYMRGGSTLGGQMFNLEPKSTLWYEPGDPFYSTYFGIEGNLPQNDVYNRDMTRRSAGWKERQWFTEYYTNIFDCRYDRLPPQLLSHRNIRHSQGLRNFAQCVDELTPTPGASDCVNLIEDFCGKRFVETSWKSNCHVVLQTTRDVLQRRNGTVQDLTALIRYELASKRVELGTAVDAGLANFTRHELCIRNIGRRIRNCLPDAAEKCRKDSVRAVKSLRHRMEDLEPLIVDNPDLFVIHYVRDRRAIAASRTRTNYLMWDKMDKRPVKEAMLLCDRMRQDLKRRLHLESKYRGVFMQVRYEDLASRPLDVAANVYSFIGKDVPKSWPDYVHAVMMASNDSVSDISQHLNGWKRYISPDQQDAIKRFCQDVLEAFHYPL